MCVEDAGSDFEERWQLKKASPHEKNKGATKNMIPHRMLCLLIAICQGVAFVVIGLILRDAFSVNPMCALKADGHTSAPTHGNVEIKPVVQGQEQSPPVKQMPTGDATTARQMPLTHPAYCPQAHCNNSALCKPCQQRFLIILSEGRAASTTLQYMLGSLPGIRMAGENRNALGIIHELFDTTLGDAIFKDGETFDGPFHHNPIPSQAQACAAQNFIQLLNPPLLNQQNKNELLLPQEEIQSEIIAFKTIRFFGPNHTNKKLAQFVNDNFPCSRFVVNVNSDVKHLEQSYERLDFGGDATSRHNNIVETQQHMREFVTLMGPERAILLDKVEWTNQAANGIGKLNDVVTWLGFSQSCHFSELLEFNTKGDGYGNGKTSLGSLNPNCTRI